MDFRAAGVKIYLCSNPEDSVVERRALRETVFPRLREHCRHTLGLDVRVIDPFESTDPSCWPDANVRQKLIEECRESSAGPFLLALVGHEYGTASLPTQVEVSEYQLLLQESQQAGISTQELERVYRRDENTIPPSYCLRSPHRHTCFPQQADVKEEEEVKMKAKEEELRKAFQCTVSLCVNKALMTAERAQSYHRSVLDADLRFALDNRPDGDIIRRCLVYIHKVINARGKREKTQVTSQQTEMAPTEGQLLSQLCDDFLPGLITSSQLLVYVTTTECDHRHGYTTARRRGYAASLCQQVYADLVGLIGSMTVSGTMEDSQACDALAREQGEQEELRNILSRFYDIIRPEEEKVRTYVEQSEHQLPLVVTGGPCSGKAVLVAHCGQQIQSWLPDCDPVVITYFCSLSMNPSPKQLLLSLCYQICSRYRHSMSSSEQSPSILDDPPHRSRCSLTSSRDPQHVSDSDQNLHLKPCPDLWDIIQPDTGQSELKERLSSLLALMPSTKQPLFLILDGLDHIGKCFGPEFLSSLPFPLPPNVKVILTVASKQTQILQAIKPRHPCGMSEGVEKESRYVCVPLGVVTRRQCVKMLTSLLSRSGRSVTSGQQALVNRALTSCSLALYARLLHPHTLLWHSDSDVTEASLPDGVHSSISALLDHLEQKHGSNMVTRAVSYLTLSRTGLTESELADLLSADDQVLSGHDQQVERVLQVDVERLLLDLRRFLIRRTVTGLHVFCWVSRHFKLVVTRRYLGTLTVRREIHSAMADYFSGWRADGRAEPLPVNPKSLPNKDRQPCSQLFDFASFASKAGRVNLRKVLELPHHLQESNKWQELEHILLMSLGFHQAMVQAGLLGDLVTMLEAEEKSPCSRFSRERGLMAGILKSYACLLRSLPLQLPTVMETNLLPYLEVFPALKTYIREIREEMRKRGSGLGVMLFPAPSSVPSLHCLKWDTQDRVAVTEVAGTERGIVAEVMEDGTAWFWKGSGCDVAKLSLSFEQKELKFAGVKTSAQFVLLSTKCDKLFLWDVTGPEMFLQLQNPLKKEHEPKSKRHTPNRIQGFVACQKKLCVWWENETSVCVFDVYNETVAHFQCQSYVTCLVCSSDGMYMYCGQEGGRVALFDTTTGRLVGTWSNSNHSTVTSMILCEDKWEMACVDHTGNVTVWDVVAKKQPPRLVKESFTGNKYKNVLNTDYSEEIHTLLVCQSHQVTLWGTCDWELWDQFLAPQGRAFTHAMLTQDGHLFLALLDTCPHALVWQVSTGECVLALETNKLPHALLKTASDVMCVAQDGHLTVWDFEMIDTAGAAPKMGYGVKGVVAEQTGEWFYTTDGSEMVWRWRLETGLPHAHFLHDGPVEKLRLSPDDIHLVTLSAGEIYVWQTETGQNIVRVSGSRATDVLVTPNGNFGVSISKHSLSQVWKLAHGSIVCSIRLYLSDAQVSPESTFLIGRRNGDLLAANLWSGSISKRFSCVADSEHVVAFHALPQHPDFVVVMAASGAVYTWKVAEETVCRHFKLPYTFHCQPSDFQMSLDGSFALLSAEAEAINLLDLSHIKLCSFKTEGPVIKACLAKSGCYIAYITGPTTLDCVCSLHVKPVLTVMRLADGERIGSVHLSKSPSTLLVSKWQCVFVVFEDGSVGVYSISDLMNSGEEPVLNTDHLKGCPFDTWLPLATPNVTWP